MFKHFISIVSLLNDLMDLLVLIYSIVLFLKS